MSSPAGGPATLKDVARLTRRHPATVSRALNGSPLVAPRTAEAIIEAAVTLGYVRNQAAASLRTQSTRTIGVLAADLSDPLLTPLVLGAEDALRDAGYMMLVASAGHTRARQRAALSGMLSRRADGLVIAAADDADLPDLAGVPILAVAAGYVSARLPSASADFATAARLVAGHLALLGHRTVACISCASGPVPTQILATAIRRAGLTVPRGLVATTAAATAEEGRRCCQALLTAGTAFTAIVTGSDMLAAGCYAALAAAGRSCPDDVSVTGFGDLPLSGSLWPPLTSIRLPQHDVGAAAARLLVTHLRQPAEPAGSLQLAPILLARESTGHPVCRRPRPSVRRAGFP